MKPKFPLVIHNPEKGQYGDCVRAAIASLLEIEPSNIPHFWSDGEGTAVEAWDRVDEFLRPLGYASAAFYYPGSASLETILNAMYVTNENTYYMLFGRSRTNTDHVVICLNDKIVHDPSIYPIGLDGPQESPNGLVWAIVVLIPVILKA